MRRVLYIARHGETDWNAAGRIQGHTDIPLNPRGLEQAKALANALRGLGIASVGSSDLLRARQTAEVVARELGLGFRGTLAALRERNYGVYEGLTLDDFRARLPEEWKRFTDPKEVPSGGESLEMVRVRMLEAVNEAVGWEPPTLVVSHGRAIRELIGEITGVPSEPVANGEVVRLVFELGRWTAAQRSPW